MLDSWAFAGRTPGFLNFKTFEPVDTPPSLTSHTLVEQHSRCVFWVVGKYVCVHVYVVRSVRIPR